MSKSKLADDTVKSTKPVAEVKRQFIFEIHMNGQTVKIN